eukprot:GGOE01049219.1.p2 GENE.GGOE01049219.1~~GGOE01049219.1.p2  ORF type:complete len:169 (-),score=8.00 GGOE01049219.1:183-617(-)
MAEQQLGYPGLYGAPPPYAGPVPGAYPSAYPPPNPYAAPGSPYPGYGAHGVQAAYGPAGPYPVASQTYRPSLYSHAATSPFAPPSPSPTVVTRPGATVVTRPGAPPYASAVRPALYSQGMQVVSIEYRNSNGSPLGPAYVRAHP